MPPAQRNRPAADSQADPGVGNPTDERANNRRAPALAPTPTVAQAPGSDRDRSAPPLPTSLDIQSLSAWFDDHKVVADITMAIQARQVTALIGPSGCGKSTLLRCLNQMHLTIPGARVRGQVLLEGHDIYEQGVDPVAVRRRIGMVFQRPNPFPTMSIYDNVAAGLRPTTRAPTARPHPHQPSAPRLARPHWRPPHNPTTTALKSATLGFLTPSS